MRSGSSADGNAVAARMPDMVNHTWGFLRLVIAVAPFVAFAGRPVVVDIDCIIRPHGHVDGRQVLDFVCWPADESDIRQDVGFLDEHCPREMLPSGRCEPEPLEGVFRAGAVQDFVWDVYRDVRGPDVCDVNPGVGFTVIFVGRRRHLGHGFLVAQDLIQVFGKRLAGNGVKELDERVAVLGFFE